MSAETIGWSKIMMDLGAIMTPAPTLEFRSLYFVAVGAQMIITGVSLTTFVQRFLSLPWLVWLGKVSWPLYLIHGTCIRTILVFVLYAIINGTRTESPQAVTIKENITIAIILPLFYVLVYYLAHLWSLHIDPLCDNVTKWMEQKVFLHDQQPYDDKEAHYMALPQAVSL
jgi:peptidoglycan/LPS O-acetylase OafA/YrhL